MRTSLALAPISNQAIKAVSRWKGGKRMNREGDRPSTTGVLAVLEKQLGDEQLQVRKQSRDRKHLADEAYNRGISHSRKGESPANLGYTTLHVNEQTD